MTWTCPTCGEDNPPDSLRCPCGHEASDNIKHQSEMTPADAIDCIRLEEVTQCPECNSQNIEKFNTFKRSRIVFIIAAIYFVVAVMTRSLGYTWYGFALLLCSGIKAALKNKNVIICRDCMYSNDNKWLKRMKDA